MRKMQLHFPFFQSQKGGVLKSAPFLFADRVVDSWLAVLESNQM